ncbi:MAG TPA: molybdopterin-dependent oxidoreductase, partial [Acidimicrobiia bacterium]|nr:molybdopterin-dependent oxidoreductase [Acidimicrobiia bacterium]
GILRAAADGKITALVLLGADPASDFPDRDLARRALEKVPFVVAVDAFPTASSARADVVLPVAIFGEKRGSSTNLEGRVLRLARKVTPPGTAMEDWRIAVELALRFDVDFDLEAVDEVTDEICRLAPAYAGCDAATLRRAADGVVVPVGEREHPVLDGPGHAVTPVADADAAVVGGPTEAVGSMVGGSSAAWGEMNPAAVATDAGATSVPDFDPPPLHEWAGDSAAAEAVPAPGSGLRLLARRKLYDAGVTVTRSPSLAALVAPPTVAVNPAEAERLGVAPGESVRICSGRGEATLTLAVDRGVPAGIASVPFNVAGAAAALLIEAGGGAVAVSLEPSGGGENP